MSAQDKHDRDEIHSKVMRAGRRTYFFDVRATRADDYYLTITESKKYTADNGHQFYKKHKIYLYKEDFEEFKQHLDEVTDFIISEKGNEVISDTHKPGSKSQHNVHKDPNANTQQELEEDESGSQKAYTDVSFEDI